MGHETADQSTTTLNHGLRWRLNWSLCIQIVGTEYKAHKSVLGFWLYFVLCPSSKHISCLPICMLTVRITGSCYYLDFNLAAKKKKGRCTLHGALLGNLSTTLDGVCTAPNWWYCNPRTGRNREWLLANRWVFYQKTEEVGDSQCEVNLQHTEYKDIKQITLHRDFRVLITEDQSTVSSSLQYPPEYGVLPTRRSRRAWFRGCDYDRYFGCSPIPYSIEYCTQSAEYIPEPYFALQNANAQTS